MESFFIIGMAISVLAGIYYIYSYHFKKNQHINKKTMKVYQRRASRFFTSRKKICVIAVGGGKDNIMLKDILHKKTQYKQIEFAVLSTAAGVNIGNADWIIHISQAELNHVHLLEGKLNFLLQKTEYLFLINGLGGSTDVVTQKIVQSAKQKNIFTVGIFTLPFSFEGKKRINQANQMLQTLSNEIDVLLPIANEKLLSEKRTLLEACALVEKLVSNVIEATVAEFNKLSEQERHIRIPQIIISIIKRSPIGKYTDINMGQKHS